MKKFTIEASYSETVFGKASATIEANTKEEAEKLLEENGFHEYADEWKESGSDGCEYFDEEFEVSEVK